MEKSGIAIQLYVKTNAKKIFANIAKRLKAAQSAAPKVLANEGQKFFVGSFERQGWRGASFRKWPDRKDTRNKRSLLVGRTRQLINSIRRSIRVANMKFIKWATDVPYASVHNDGYNGLVRVRSHDRGKFTNRKVGTGIHSIRTRKERSKRVRERTGNARVLNYTRKVRIPQRRFMGNSPILARILVKKYHEMFHQMLSKR